MKTYFSTLNNSDSMKNWLEFDFKTKRVVLSGYEIKAPNVTCCLTNSPSVEYMATPKSWKMLGSNDKKKWDTLDTQDNRSELNGENNVGYFDCKTPTHKGYRYIRFVQNESWNESVAPRFQYDINIGKFELYGKILE